MKVFISWSGERSKAVAKILREWLPSVLVTVDPWMSEEDIEKGQRWSSEIAARLSECRVGIVCVTSDNASRPWLCFEAGAISKTLSETFVCPFLLDVAPSDVTGPLAQFQATTPARDDVKRLLESLNRTVASNGERAFSGTQLEMAFARAWSDLENALRDIPPPTREPPPHRSEREILSEILNLVRGIARSNDDSRSRPIDLTSPLAAMPHADTLRNDLSPQDRIVNALLSAAYLQRTSKPSGDTAVTEMEATPDPDPSNPGTKSR